MESKPEVQVYCKKETAAYNESQMIRGAILSGDDSIQTWISLLETAFLAKKWATELPICLTWENLQERKPLSSTRT